MKLSLTLFTVGLLLVFGLSMPAAQDNQQEFLDGIKSEIENNKPEAFFARFLDVGLFEVELREAVRAGIGERMGKEVTGIEIGPITALPPERQKVAEEKFAQAKIPMPTYLVKLSFSEDGGTSSMRFPVSEVNGKLFIVW